MRPSLASAPRTVTTGLWLHRGHRRGRILIELFRYRYQCRKFLRYFLKCSVGYRRVRKSMCRSETVTRVDLLHRQRTSQTHVVLCCVWRWKIGIRYSIYHLGTLEAPNHKNVDACIQEYKCIVIIIVNYR